MVDNRRAVKMHKKKKKRKRILKWVLVPLSIILLSVVTYGTFLFSKAQTAINASLMKRLKGIQYVT